MPHLPRHYYTIPTQRRQADHNQKYPLLKKLGFFKNNSEKPSISKSDSKNEETISNSDSEDEENSDLEDEENSESEESKIKNMSKIQYKTKEKLLEEYSKNYKKIGFKEGSHNEVYIFQD